MIGIEQNWAEMERIQTHLAVLDQIWFWSCLYFPRNFVYISPATVYISHFCLHFPRNFVYISRYLFTLPPKICLHFRIFTNFFHCSTEKAPEVVETPKETTEEPAKEAEVKNGDSNGAEAKNGEAKNGDSENGHKNGDSNGAEAKNGDHKEETNGAEAKNGDHKNGDSENGDKKEETNGDEAKNGDSEDKEATKRKAEEDTTPEAVPVSAEKIAKLKEGEEEKTEAKEAETTA